MLSLAAHVPWLDLAESIAELSTVLSGLLAKHNLLQQAANDSHLCFSRHMFSMAVHRPSSSSLSHFLFWALAKLSFLVSTQCDALTQCATLTQCDTLTHSLIIISFNPTPSHPDKYDGDRIEENLEKKNPLSICMNRIRNTLRETSEGYVHV